MAQLSALLARKPAPAAVNLGRLLKWNPDQERDENGRFGGGGGSLKSLFSDSLGMQRANMPQIPNGELKNKFIAEQAQRGVTTTPETVPASALKPTQADFNPENIAYLRQAVADGTFKDTNPLIVSREGRVLDGHHRWAGAAMDGEKLSVLRVDLPIHELLAEAKSFNDRNGVAPRTTKDKIRAMKFVEAIELLKTYRPPAGLALLKAWDADQPRDEFGRWAGDGASSMTGKPRPAIIAAAPQGRITPMLVARDSGSTKGRLSDMTPAAVLPSDLLLEAQTVALSAKNDPAPTAGLTRDQADQAARELAPTLAAAAAAKPRYDEKLQAIAQRLGGEAITAPLKGGTRLLEKHVLENGSDAGLMRDSVRGSIIVKSVADVPAAIEAIKAQFPVVEGRIKDRFAKPLPTGYRDVLINVHLPGGIQGEVQIHIPEMIAAKSIGHKVYDVSRAMSPSDARYPKLEDLQSRIYGAAMETQKRNNP